MLSWEAAPAGDSAAEAPAAAHGLSVTDQQQDLAADMQQALGGSSAAGHRAAAAVAAAMNSAAAGGGKSRGAGTCRLRSPCSRASARSGTCSPAATVRTSWAAAEADAAAGQAGVPQLMTELLAEELHPADVAVALRHMLNNVRVSLGCRFLLVAARG